MKRVGIVTVHTGYNYGSSLQAYATKCILNEAGYSSEILSLKGGLIKGRDVRLNKLAVIGARMLCHPTQITARLNTYKKSSDKKMSKDCLSKFDAFSQDYITPQYLSWNELKKYTRQDDLIACVCGSDQIWNAETLYVDPFYYLKFAPQSKRIAFAPSFGREYIPEYNKGKLKKHINGIDFLSVREESGVKLIHGLTGRQAEWILDPTLILSSEQWKKKLGVCTNEKTDILKENYLLAYFLDDPSTNAVEFMCRLAKEKGLKIISIPYETTVNKWVNVAEAVGPKEFVELVSKAQYVCTDSFHGTVFSINFEVPFFTFERQYGSAGKQSARITSILRLLHMENRYNPEIDVSNKEIDFSRCQIILEAERKKAYLYLEKSFNIMVDGN